MQNGMQILLSDKAFLVSTCRRKSNGIRTNGLGGWEVGQLWSLYNGPPFSVSASGTSQHGEFLATRRSGETERADLREWFEHGAEPGRLD